MRSFQVPFLIFFSCLMLAFSVQARPEPQVIEMDGKRFSEKESLDLIYFRTEYDVLVDFKEIRLNGKLIDTIEVDRDRYLSVLVDVGQVEEVRSGKNRKIRRTKMQKIGLICTDKTLSVQGDFHLNPHVALYPGTSVVFKMDDQPLQKSGNLIKLFVCPPLAGNQVQTGPSAQMPPPPSRRGGSQ